MLMSEKIPGSPHFSVLQATESWAGPGYKANCTSIVSNTGCVTGVSRDSPNVGSQNGKFANCQETDTTWSQWEPYQ